MGADKFGWDDDDLVFLKPPRSIAAKSSGVKRQRHDAKPSDAEKADVAVSKGGATHQD